MSNVPRPKSPRNNIPIVINGQTVDPGSIGSIREQQKTEVSVPKIPLPTSENKSLIRPSSPIIVNIPEGKTLENNNDLKKAIQPPIINDQQEEKKILIHPEPRIPSPIISRQQQPSPLSYKQYAPIKILRSPSPIRQTTFESIHLPASSINDPIVNEGKSNNFDQKTTEQVQPPSYSQQTQYQQSQQTQYQQPQPQPPKNYIAGRPAMPSYYPPPPSFAGNKSEYKGPKTFMNSEKPDYNNITPRQRAEYLAFFRYGFSTLRNSMPNFQIPEIPDNADLDLIDDQYRWYLKQIFIERNYYEGSFKWRLVLIVLWYGIEMFMTKLLGLDMGGFTVDQLQVMVQYDYLLIELGEKCSESTGSSMPVELRILIISFLNALLFLIFKLVSKNMNQETSAGIRRTISNFLGSFVAPRPNDGTSGSSENGVMGLLGPLISSFMGGSSSTSTSTSSTSSQAPKAPKKRIGPKYTG